MKLSMWMLADWLNAYHPIANITSNTFSIWSAPLITNELTANDQTQYIRRISH